MCNEVLDSEAGLQAGLLPAYWQSRNAGFQADSEERPPTGFEPVTFGFVD